MSAQADSRVALPALSPWGTAAQRANQRRDKREALLQAAARLFRQHGFAGTSLDHIAAQLGISKPTLYYYVACKASLVQACAEQGAQQALSAVQQALQVAVTQGAGPALYAYAQAVATDYGWCMVRAEEYALPEAARASSREYRQALELALQPALGQGLLAAAVLRAVEGMALHMAASQWQGLIALLAAGPQHRADRADRSEPQVKLAQQVPAKAEPAQPVPVPLVAAAVLATPPAPPAAADAVVLSVPAKRPARARHAKMPQGDMTPQLPSTAREQISLF